MIRRVMTTPRGLSYSSAQARADGGRAPDCGFEKHLLWNLVLRQVFMKRGPLRKSAFEAREAHSYFRDPKLNPKPYRYPESPLPLSRGICLNLLRAEYSDVLLCVLVEWGSLYQTLRN